MERGQTVDIVTGRPPEAAETVLDTGARKEEKLHDRAAALGISQSADGVILVNLISKRLEKRLEALAANDAECAAYIAVLQDLGYTESAARRVVNALYERHLKRKTP